MSPANQQDVCSESSSSLESQADKKRPLHCPLRRSSHNSLKNVQLHAYNCVFKWSQSHSTTCGSMLSLLRLLSSVTRKRSNSMSTPSFSSLTKSVQLKCLQRLPSQSHSKTENSTSLLRLSSHINSKKLSRCPIRLSSHTGHIITFNSKSTPPFNSDSNQQRSS